MNTYTYVIGTLDGQYPAGDFITDSKLKEKVSVIVKGQQAYNIDFTQNNGTLHHGNIFTTVNGDVLTMLFEN